MLLSELDELGLGDGLGSSAATFSDRLTNVAGVETPPGVAATGDAVAGTL